MTVNVGKELAALQRLTIKELKAKYAEVFGEATNAANRAWLVKRIAWRLQALAEGDLSERARRRAAELANDADLRLSPPKVKAAPAAGTLPEAGRTVSGTLADKADDRLPLPGTVLTREYKGSVVQVQVLPNGFEYAGDVYKSLSAVAKAITGQHVNGFAFFKLAKEAVSMNKTRKPTPAQPAIRCAIYTRKSTEEGLEQEFNTLDAQRECAEAFIKSQAAEGWQCLPDRYDDGGFTGGNMDRPALKRLLADIEGGRVDAVIVYKVDRLSRSLLDFARMLETFEKHQIAFISVTQQINSATSMGRLMLNVLLSFAQFERELVSERTRDKIAATRRKGKWAGGHHILGYDVDAKSTKLVVNEDEAARVRAIFALYLEHQGLVPVVQELQRRGWTNKRWTTRKGHMRGGRPFSKTSLHKLLTNVTYSGQVRYKTELHGGEQPAIIDADVWQRVQVVLQRNGRNGGAAASRNQFGALLKGLLRCVPCGCAMTPAHSTKKGKRYRYYTCTAAQKNGWHTCPSKSIPAGEIEQFVVEQIRCIGHDPVLRHETFAHACTQAKTRIDELLAERRGLERDLEHWHADIRALVAPGVPNASAPDLSRLADLQERIRAAEQRATAIKNEIGQLSAQQLAEDEVARALSVFEPLWESLTSREQAELLHLLVERVDYDGAHDKVSITFHAAGIKSLADEFAEQQREKRS